MNDVGFRWHHDGAGVELQHGRADTARRNVLRLTRQLEDERHAIAGVEQRNVLEARFRQPGPALSRSVSG